MKLVLLCIISWATVTGGKPAEKFKFDIDLSTLSKPPLWEPTVDEYFSSQSAKTVDENGLPSPVVLDSPQSADFAFHARRGYPILVSDWSRGMRYDGWTGKNFSEKFPFGYMKAEYIDHLPGYRRQDHDVKIIDGEQRFNIGTFKPNSKTMWYNFTRPASKRYKDDPLKPQTGPYVWHVKDELTPKQKKKVQAIFEAPSFLNDPLNKQHMNNTFELWFSPGSRSGAGAHADGYCESVVSLQLRGDKKWRKMMLPPMSFLDSFDEFDGGVYVAERWQPDLGFVNYQSGAVIWPPGYLHETSTLQPPDGECGAAITMQFAFPQPVQFLRAFLPRLSLSAEVGQCVKRAWSGYPTLYVPGIKPVSKMSKMQEQRLEILKNVDVDNSGTITLDEVEKWFRKPKCTVQEEQYQFPREHQDLFIKFKAEDTVAYHDMDDDKVISSQELWDSLVQWNVVRVRMSRGLQFVNIADKDGLIAFEKSLDHMRREPLQIPTKLRPELEALFRIKKGTKIFPSLKNVNSFSDSEFFSEVRERVDELLGQQGQEL